MSGFGKTTVARALAARLGVPHVELDAIFHKPGWTGLDDQEFARRVEAATADEAWVVDGNYSRIQPIIWSRADTVVVLALPRWRVLSQLLIRTLRRGWTGEELWAGNRESLRNLIRRDPERNILLWSFDEPREAAPPLPGLRSRCALVRARLPARAVAAGGADSGRLGVGAMSSAATDGLTVGTCLNQLRPVDAGGNCRGVPLASTPRVAPPGRPRREHR